ncbi:unnamed protein product, partial [Brassica oleracea]
PLPPSFPPSPPSYPPSPSSLKLEKERERGKEREKKEKKEESSPELVAGETVRRDHVQLATTDKHPRFGVHLSSWRSYI